MEQPGGGVDHTDEHDVEADGFLNAEGDGLKIGLKGAVGAHRARDLQQLRKLVGAAAQKLATALLFFVTLSIAYRDGSLRGDSLRKVEHGAIEAVDAAAVQFDDADDTALIGDGHYEQGPDVVVAGGGQRGRCPGCARGQPIGGGDVGDEMAAARESNVILDGIQRQVAGVRAQAHTGGRGGGV